MTRRRTWLLVASATAPVVLLAAAVTVTAHAPAEPVATTRRVPSAGPLTAQQDTAGHRSTAGPQDTTGHRNSAGPQDAAAQQDTGGRQEDAGLHGGSGRELTVVATGDVLLHGSLWARSGAGYDFHRLLAQVRDVVSAADLAVCHLETPVGEPGGPFSGYPRFVVPPQIVPALADTGYDTCSTASNHTLDAGAAGVRRTLAALDAAGLAHPGSARSAAERDAPVLLDVRGVRVAHLSYTFSFNGLRTPAGQPWLANQLRADTVLADAARARRAGAQIVLVSLHWGTEYRQAADAGQVALAGRLLASPDIDLLLGHHAHVVQPFERIGDRWAVYGMGNLVAHQPQLETTRDGVLARITLREGPDGRWRPGLVEALPLWMDLTGTGRMVLVPAALDDPTTPGWLREACLQSLRRTTASLVSRGADAAGLVVRASLRRG